jgi:hypothetical protein
MRMVLTLILVLADCVANGQDHLLTPTFQSSSQSSLPDAPSQVLMQRENPASEDQDHDQDQAQNTRHGEDQQSIVIVARDSFITSGTRPPGCRRSLWGHARPVHDPSDTTPLPPLLCINILDPYARFLDTRFSIPMTPAQKGYLALHDLLDPFNLATVAASSAFTIGIDSHTAYGPGWKGFGKLAGVSLLQDATGEFFGTFLIPSIAHQDPHYHRMPTAHFTRRFIHAVSRTVIAQNDNGSSMPNYATLLTYPIASEISNLYVPGIHTNGPSTIARIGTGYALDPVNNIVTEFLPDVAKRIHIRIIFVQRILNQIAAPAAAPAAGPS